MYIHEYYSTEKRGWFGNLGKLKISKVDIAKLLANATDEKLIETIRYIYNINEVIIYNDLIMISNKMTCLLEKHYDQVIKNLGIDLSKEQANKIEHDFNLLKDLIKKYEPEPQK